MRLLALQDYDLFQISVLIRTIRNHCPPTTTPPNTTPTQLCKKNSTNFTEL